MNQQQQRILMRSSLAMGVTVAVGMLAFGQLAPTARTTPSEQATAESAQVGQVATTGDQQGGLVAMDIASSPVLAEDISMQPQEFARASRDRDDEEHEDAEHEDEERHESSKRSEHTERREHR